LRYDSRTSTEPPRDADGGYYAEDTKNHAYQRQKGSSGHPIILVYPGSPRVKVPKVQHDCAATKPTSGGRNWPRQAPHLRL
jgi:hypothetical protein